MEWAGIGRLMTLTEGSSVRQLAEAMIAARFRHDDKTVKLTMNAERLPIDLDANATTAPLPEVLAVMQEVAAQSYGNPGSRHQLGRRSRRHLEESRETIAAILGAAPDEVCFTSGGTEANNLAIQGIAAQRGRLDRQTILRMPGEHPSAAETTFWMQSRGWELAEFPLDAAGRIRWDDTERLPWDRIGLATAILAHNETGVVQDITPLGARCAERSIPWHLDGVQAVGKIPVNFQALGATTLSCGAHKFHGPRGIGALLIRRGTTLPPLFRGGHQESDWRPGTEPVWLAAGMAQALQLWSDNQVGRSQRLTSLRDQLEAGLASACAPVVIHGREAPRLPNTTNVAFPGLNGEALLVALDLAGVCCSLGSTCASGSTEPAPVLLAMGVSAEEATASVRFSLSLRNTPAEIDQAVQTIAEVVHRLRNSSAGRL